jgi:hypothetical protein
MAKKIVSPEVPEYYTAYREDLIMLPRKLKVKEGETEYNFRSRSSAEKFIRDTASARHGSPRVRVFAHDSANDLMIEFFSNPGHTPGITVNGLQDKMHGNLEKALREASPIGELGRLDFFQFRVVE